MSGEYTSTWKSAWTEFSRLTGLWVSLGWTLGHNTILNPLGFDEARAWAEVTEHFDAYRDPDQHAAVREVRERIEEARQAKEPLEDVWQAALKISGTQWFPRAAQDHPVPMLAPRRESAATSPSYLYRGQRHLAWWVIPSVFRPEREGTKQPSQPEIRTRQKRLDQIVACMAHFHPGFSYGQRLATAQHYRDILDTGTWLIDTTRDPLVALFFASYIPDSPGSPTPPAPANDPNEEQVGVVEAISIREYERYFGGYGGPVEIDVPFVPRITAQRAVFVDCPHPHLWEQYLGHRVTFYQRPGAMFEDPTFGVTRDLLLPGKDPYIDQAAAIAEHVEHPAHPLFHHRVRGRNASRRPWIERMDPLKGDDYVRIIRQGDPWDKWDDLDQMVRSRAEAVCDFHAKAWALQADRPRDRVSVPRIARSWRRLQDALAALNVPEYDSRLPSLKELLVRYSERAVVWGDGSEEVRRLAEDFLAGRTEG